MTSKVIIVRDLGVPIRSVAGLAALLLRQAPPFAVAAWLCVFAAGAATEPPADRPGRIATSYALTAPRHQDPDMHDGSTPKDWRLLGSSNDGQTWQTIDSRTNELFPSNNLRRVFAVTNRVSYNIYRLEVNRTRDDNDTASLAELELMGPVTGTAKESLLRMKITSSRASPLRLPASQAFDGDPASDWFDFGLGGAAGRWIQCQYTTNAEVMVSDIAQLVLTGRGVSLRDSFTWQSSNVISNFVARTNRPVRRLVGYSLTSANDFYPRDPTDWQLLGSSDEGKTWEVLDVRRNETFPRRLQKRNFALAKPAAYAIYRLQIDSVFTPALANSVALAEIEPQWADGQARDGLTLVVSARGENTPWEVIERAFDRDLTTKWLDFSRGSTNRASWVQWQFAAINGPPVVSLNRLLAARPQQVIPAKLDLEAIVVGRGPRDMSLVDHTGFEVIHLTLADDGGQPGDRVRLTGNLEFANGKPLLMHPEMTVLGHIKNVPPGQAGLLLETNQGYVLGSVEGDAQFLTQDAEYSTIRLDSVGGTNSVLARILNSSRRQLPNPLNCRLRVRGVVESISDGNGGLTPGIVWISKVNDVALVAPSSKDWSQLPAYTVKDLAATNAFPRGLVRATGTVGDQGDGRYPVLTEGTNEIVIYTVDSNTLAPGSRAEAVGFLGRESRRTILRWAICRAAAETFQPSGVAIDAEHPVTDIGEVNRMRQTNQNGAFPVRLHGVITYISGSYLADDNNFYIQDDTNAIEVLSATSAGLDDAIQQEGTYVEIAGRNTPDGVKPTSFAKFLGKGQMPEPIRNPFDAMMSPQNAGRWAQVEGVVSGYNDGRLTLLVEGRELTVWVNQITLGPQCRVPGCRLRVSGVCDPIVNARDQLLGSRLLVPTSECIEVVNPGPADPFLLPTVAIASVLLSSPGVAGGQMQMVKSEGVVTYAGPQMLCVQDKDSGMRVFLQRASTNIEPGDRVEVVGLALPDGFTPKLVEALARRTGRGDLPSAVNIDFMQNYMQSAQDATRGQMDAVFEGRGASGSTVKLELLCEATRRNFYAYLPAAAPLPTSLLPGSRVRLRGVIKLQAEEALDANQVVTAFEMYLNSPADIQVLEAPSWWTARHTLWLVGGLGSVLIVSLGWISALRRQVRRQTRALEQENAERKQAQVELAASNAALQKENLERKQAEQVLRSQEERTRLIIDLAFDAVVTADIDFRVTCWNLAAEKTLGWTCAEILGRNLLETIVPSGSREKRRADLERFRATGEWSDLNCLVQTTAMHRDGRELPIELTITPIRLGDHYIFTLFLRDITDRKKAEADLAHERHLLESLLENSADYIYFKDRDSRFLRCSDALRKWLGGSTGNLIGKTDFDLFTEEHARPAFEDEQEIIRTGRPLIGKVEREVAKDNRVSWALTSKMPLRNRAGEIVGTFGISKDITTLKQAEAELEHTHKELVQASRMAGMAEVATSVLHNVGNVLNSINVSVSVVDEKVRKSRVADMRRLAKLLEEHAEDRAAFLSNDPKGKKVPDFISHLAEQLVSEQAAMLEEISSLRKNVEHVKEIIAMQQSYARVSGVFENIKVTDLLEDSLRMNEGSLARHDVKVVRDFDDLREICTDKHKVLQILINLVRNAKYACDESGRDDKQIILRATNGGDRVKIAVIDNGVGIPLENLTRIFNHGFTTRKDGHGFGLHSGALAAKELSGALTAYSEGPGLGAAFTLELPCKPPAENKIAHDLPHDAIATR